MRKYALVAVMIFLALPTTSFAHHHRRDSDDEGDDDDGGGNHSRGTASAMLLTGQFEAGAVAVAAYLAMRRRYRAESVGK